jgi:hypothetical protein
VARVAALERVPVGVVAFVRASIFERGMAEPASKGARGQVDGQAEGDQPMASVAGCCRGVAPARFATRGRRGGAGRGATWIGENSLTGGPCKGAGWLPSVPRSIHGVGC